VDSLNENKTWELLAPNAQKALTGKWVFKIKKRSDGTLRYKARWVVHGYRQQYGIDYNETFASVVKAVSHWTIISMAAKRNLPMHQMDVVTAFLYGLLDELVFVVQPIRFGDGTGRVCRLLKALFGLKHSPRVWYATIEAFLKTLGLKPTQADQCVFVSSDGKVIMAIYVDDLLVIGEDENRISSIKAKLSQRFRMTDLGPTAKYLGIEIFRTNKGIIIHQMCFVLRWNSGFVHNAMAP